MSKANSSRLSPSDVPPETLAQLGREATDARVKLAHKPGIEDVDFPSTVPFAGVLRGVLADLKSARESSGLTIAAVAQKTGIAAETLSRLENGKLTNPTWNTLGAYAAAVGCRLEMKIFA